MALEATHIRFALDLKERLKVSDVGRFVVGAIYPDSRYVTKIDRALTHPKDYLDWDLSQADDFKKGWFTHLLCDKVQWLVLKEMRPDIFEGEVAMGSPVWIRHTALKILQDFADVKAFELPSNINALGIHDLPNNEDGDKVAEYYGLMQGLYKDPASLKLEDYAVLWKAFGLPQQVGEALAAQVREYGNDVTVSEMLDVVYGKMLKRAEQSYEDREIRS